MYNFIPFDKVSPSYPHVLSNSVSGDIVMQPFMVCWFGELQSTCRCECVDSSHFSFWMQAKHSSLLIFIKLYIVIHD